MVRYSGVWINFMGRSAHGVLGAVDVMVKAGDRVRTKKPVARRSPETSFARKLAILKSKMRGACDCPRRREENVISYDSLVGKRTLTISVRCVSHKLPGQRLGN